MATEHQPQPTIIEEEEDEENTVQPTQTSEDENIQTDVIAEIEKSSTPSERGDTKDSDTISDKGVVVESENPPSEPTIEEPISEEATQEETVDEEKPDKSPEEPDSEKVDNEEVLDNNDKPEEKNDEQPEHSVEQGEEQSESVQEMELKDKDNESEEEKKAEAGDGGEMETVRENEDGEMKTVNHENDIEIEEQQQEEPEPERVESPVAVGEKLSREGSPSLDQHEMHLESLEPTSPRAPAGSEIEESVRSDEEEEEDEPEYTREQLLDQYHSAIAHKEQLQILNYQMQHKLADYFRKKKSEDSRQEMEKNVTDQEQRYLKYMANLEELRKQDMVVKESYEYEIQQNLSLCEAKLADVEADRRQFVDYKNVVATKAINSRSGKTIPAKDIEQYLLSEMKKEIEVINVRLENIKVKNKLKKKEQHLKSKEELAEGLHLIDFEQLKIENQTYNEKIEERNEELLKLRKKITSTVQVLTHLKEKLQFVQGENLVSNGKLKDVEHLAAQKRDILSRTKQARDALRIENQKLRESAGLLGNESLLRDYEYKKDDLGSCHSKLDQLKMQHAENTLNCNQVRRKIEQVRVQQS